MLYLTSLSKGKFYYIFIDLDEKKFKISRGGGVIHGETKGNKQWLTIDYTETQRLNNTTPGVPEGLTVLLYQRHLDVGERYRKYI